MSRARYEPHAGAERVGWGTLMGSALREHGGEMNLAPGIMWAIFLVILLFFL